MTTSTSSTPPDSPPEASNSRSRSGLVIVDGVRTPFTKMGTDFAQVSAVELGRTAVNALLTKTGLDPSLIDETIFGCVCQPADSANIARVIALRSGIPRAKPAMTVHRNCASGLEALTTANERVAAGRGEVFLIGGTENMSQVPFFYKMAAVAKFTAMARAKNLGQRLGAMAAFRPSDFAPIIGLKLGLADPVVGLNMGQTAENLAREFHLTRDEQDEFALKSHQRATAAKSLLREEMAPVFVAGSKKNHVLADNGVREKQTLEALGKLKPVFERSHGTVTAGNASQITDGAVAMLVMTERKAEELGMEPLGRLVDYRYSGCDPARMGVGPAHSIAELKSATGLAPEDADVIEINEAFAAQVLAVLKCLESAEFAAKFGLSSSVGAVPRDRLNPNGGAIALGHPVGASGARLVLTALQELRRTQGKRALVSLCVGGGQGGAAWLERI